MLQQFGSTGHADVADVFFRSLSRNLHHLTIELAAPVTRGMRQIVDQEIDIRQMTLNLHVHNLAELAVAVVCDDACRGVLLFRCRHRLRIGSLQTVVLLDKGHATAYQQGGTERFGHVGIGTIAYTLQLLLYAADGRKQDEGHVEQVVVATHLLQQFNAVHQWHLNVAHHQVEPFFAQDVERLHAILRRGDMEVFRQSAADILAHVLIVVHHQHAAVVERFRLQLLVGGHQLRLLLLSIVVILQVLHHVEIVLGLVNLLRGWQHHREDAASHRIVVILYAAMMHQHHLFGKVQSDAETVRTHIGLNEPCEQLLLLLFRHAHARVFHQDGQFALCLQQAHPHHDGTFARCILKCVAQQVVHDFIDVATVYIGNVFLGERHKLQTHLAVLRHIVETHGDVAQEADDIGLLQPERQLAVVQLVELQQLVDESQQPVGAALHVAQGLLQRRRQIARLAHTFHRTLNEGERCAELVADVHEEVLLELADFFFHADAVAHGVGHLQQANDVPGNAAHHSQIDQPGPPGVPPRLTDDDTHRGFLVGVAARYSHTESVFPRMQILIHGLILPGGQTPLAVESV